MKPPVGNSDMCFTSFGRTSVNSSSKPQKLVQTGGDHTTSCLNGMWLCVWGPTMCSWHHYEVVIQISSMCLCAAECRIKIQGLQICIKMQTSPLFRPPINMGIKMLFLYFYTRWKIYFLWCYFTSWNSKNVGNCMNWWSYRFWSLCKYPWNDSDFIQNDTSHCLSFSFYFFKVCWWSFRFYWTKTAEG